jgi:hypothetical protein
MLQPVRATARCTGQEQPTASASPRRPRPMVTPQFLCDGHQATRTLPSLCPEGYPVCVFGCGCYPEVLGKENVVMARPRSQGPHGHCKPHPGPPLHAPPHVGWLRGQRWVTWLVPVRPVRPRVTSSVITARSSADLKRPPLVVVLGSPLVAPDYAEQISHGSPSSTSVWMALTLHGSGRPVSECAGAPGHSLTGGWSWRAHIGRLAGR